jgi:hypothetical protein
MEKVWIYSSLHELAEHLKIDYRTIKSKIEKKEIEVKEIYKKRERKWSGKLKN